MSKSSFPILARLTVLGALASSCGGTPPRADAPASTQPPTSDYIQITGRERLGWNQATPAAASLRFAIYVDGNTRLELPGVSCTSASETEAACESPLPPLPNGKHTLELVARFNGDDAPEGARAAPIKVEVVNAGLVSSQSAAVPGVEPPTAPRLAASAGASPSGCGVVPLPGGDILTWDSSGRIGIAGIGSHAGANFVRDALDDSGWVFGAVAVHPDFDGNGLMYVAEMSVTDPARVRLVRYRRLGNVLGERAALFEQPLTVRPARIRLAAAAERLSLAMLDGIADAGQLERARRHRFVIRLLHDGRAAPENGGHSVFADTLATRAVDLAWAPDGGSLRPIEQTGRDRFAVTPSERDAEAPPLTFAAASAPVAAALDLTAGGRRRVRVVLANAELVTMAEGSAAASVQALGPLRDMPVVQDAAWVGADVAVCGPTTGREDAPRRYGVARVRIPE